MGMSYGQCKSCGIAISYNKIPVCTKCLNDYFVKVRDYIYETGVRTPEEIKTATKVPLRVIDYFVETGALIDLDKEPGNEMEKSKRYEKLKVLNEMKQTIIAEHNNSVNNTNNINNNNNSGMRFVGKIKK